ncbi:MAG: hypothetical protein Kow00108_11240 [Calditrichia bacterium]
MSDEIKQIGSQANLNLISSKINQLKAVGKSAHSEKEIEEAANQFESLFIYQLLKEMRKTIMKSDLLGDGLGGEIFQSMWDEKIAEAVSRSSRLGIAEMVMQSFNPDDSNRSPEEFLQLSKTDKQISLITKKVHPLKQRLAAYENEIKTAADTVKINPRLLKAVILVESGGNPSAVSSKGAKGLMQLIDSTAASVGVSDPFNPAENILGGATYLKKMLKQFDGNLKLALAAYNAGPGAVSKYNDVPPYKETRSYVTKVMNLFKSLK